MFWNNFVKICEEHGEKPTPVIKKLGIAAGSVTRWKNGSVPNGKTLDVIANYFNVSVDYLLGKTDETKKAPVVNDEGGEGYYLLANRGKDGSAIEQLSKEEYNALIAWIQTLRRNINEDL